MGLLKATQAFWDWKQISREKAIEWIKSGKLKGEVRERDIMVDVSEWPQHLLASELRKEEISKAVKLVGVFTVEALLKSASDKELLDEISKENCEKSMIDARRKLKSAGINL